MRSFFLFFALMTSAMAWAEKHDGHHKHSLSAHEHGTVKISMAIEGNKIEIDMEGPSESFLGFEHKAKTRADQLTLKRAKELWNAELLAKLILFEGALGCKSESTSFEQTSLADGHSEIEAVAQLSCAGDPKGTDMKIALKNIFPKIKKLKLEIVGTQSKVLDIKKAIENVRL